MRAIVRIRKLALILPAIAAGLLALHRALLWMEARGWIYWTRRKPSGGALGNAFLEMQQLVDPPKRHGIEMEKTRRKQENDAGDQPWPGA